MDYHLRPVGKTCSVTGEELAPGSHCHSVLIEREGELIRVDFSADAWDQPPEGTVAHWRCVVPEPESTKAKAIDTEGLMRYFEQLVEDANPAQEPLRYVLALLLLQKKRLKLEGSRLDNETEVLELTGSRGEGPFQVCDQHLTAEEIQGLQQELNAHLATEWS